MKYTHLTEKERENLFELKNRGFSCRVISMVMSRSKSTISREVRRNKPPGQDSLYLPDRAHRIAQARRISHSKKITKSADLQGFVVSHLYKKWSPMIIAGRMRQQALPFYASPETI